MNILRKKDAVIYKFKILRNFEMIWDFHCTREDFAEMSKNLARYRFENNFVALLK